MRINASHVVGDETRQALIEGATSVFIEDGFRAARVQDIATAAGVRVSAINYHFGSKEGLYHAVLQYHAELAITAKPLASDSPDLPLRERFGFLIAALVSRVLDPDSPSRLARLILRENASPTAAMDMMFERFFQSQFSVLHSVLREFFGPQPSDDEIARAGLSVIGQVLVYAAAEPLINRLRPDFYGDPQHLTTLATHIAEFSWGGIHALRDRTRSQA